MIRVSSYFLCLAFCALTLPALAQHDFSALPVSPEEMHKRIAGRALTLEEAITIAQDHVGGIASEARFNRVGEDNASGATVVVYTEIEKFTVSLDGISKEVISSTSTPKFPGLPSKTAMVTTPSGLMYFDLIVGEGAVPPTPTSKVEVNYTGWLNDNSKFSSSYDSGQTITFPLNGVIRGWSEGVGSMRVGGIRKLIIPASLAYGEMGRPPVIPPSAVLIFDIELVSLPELATPEPVQGPQDAQEPNEPDDQGEK
jgi:FKBP-type peptidyl-prolyl isomerase-like protein